MQLPWPIAMCIDCSSSDVILKPPPVLGTCISLRLKITVPWPCMDVALIELPLPISISEIFFYAAMHMLSSLLGRVLYVYGTEQYHASMQMIEHCFIGTCRYAWLKCNKLHWFVRTNNKIWKFLWNIEFFVIRWGHFCNFFFGEVTNRWDLTRLQL